MIGIIINAKAHHIIGSIVGIHLITFKTQVMVQKTLYSSEKHSAYPGQYIASPLTLEGLTEKLQKPHEGEARPLVNIEEMPDAFIIEMAVPGLKSSDFYVSIKGNIITVAFLNNDEGCDNKSYYQHEFNFCCSKREIIIPGNIDADFLNAQYKDGILCIRLPKCDEQVMNDIERIIIY